MYEEYFGLSAQPFRLNPDPKFFFGSKSHNKAMAYLHYGLKQGEGFIVITGPIGSGKSMIIGHLVDQLTQSNVMAAHLLTSTIEPADLLGQILSAFRIEPENEGRTGELEAFEDYLFDQLNRGRRVLLVIDEAQNLPLATLEELRMLSNIDYDGTPLFQVFLVGQPEFKDILASPNLEQLRQRVIASYHLEVLSLEETKEYLFHRLSVVGWDEDPSITDDAVDRIFNETGGLPRKINTLCNRVMMFAAMNERHEITGETVGLVIDDLNGEKGEPEGASAVAAAPERTPDISQPQTEGRDGEERDNVVVSIDDARNKIDERQRNTLADGDNAMREEKVQAESGAAKVMADEQKKKESTCLTQAGPEPQAQSESVEVSPARSALPPIVKSEALMSEKSKSGKTDEGDASEERNDQPPEEQSVFDRLRSRNAVSNAGTPASATLTDVASAIAAVAQAQNDPARTSLPVSQDEDALPPRIDDIKKIIPEKKRPSVLHYISDTRDDIKKAHESVTKLRKTMSLRQTNREKQRARISESLKRAETLLNEMRDT